MKKNQTVQNDESEKPIKYYFTIFKDLVKLSLWGRIQINEPNDKKKTPIYLKNTEIRM